MQREPLLRGTSVDKNVVLYFDGEEFAKSVAICAKELWKVDNTLAIEYVKSMTGITLKVENCNSNNTTNHNHNPFDK